MPEQKLNEVVTHDADPIETQEWLDALSAVVQYMGTDRALFILQKVMHKANKLGVDLAKVINTDYVNTIDVKDQVDYPGDLTLEERILTYIRWNAVAMVVRAGQKAKDVGGHLATYASAAILYETGFNHFFHAASENHGGDLIYIQGHSSPGIYARSYLEGRFTDKHLENFRQEIQEKSLSSYPHPWLMPDYWQFATVSMGLGPLMAIYQARFLKYLQHRELLDTTGRKVWTFCGDGEMDEPESLGALSLAGREHLDNLIFVINCNLQRLDGPVRGNGKIIQELERVFIGSGWHVIKVLWGSGWDTLLAKDDSGLLQQRMLEVVDGEFQNYVVQGGAYIREHFFGKYPELQALIKDYSDEDLEQLARGGHDPIKVYNAYHKAIHHKNQPVVILAHTIKGFGLGEAGEALNTAHNQKKMKVDEIKAFRGRLSIPVKDDDVEKLPFIKFKKESAEYQYLEKHRKALGGYLPHRRSQSTALTVPALEKFSALLKDTGDRHISTTMAFVRAISVVLKDKTIGKYVVPIIPDECRTFGMEGLFRQVGIYSPAGQLYKPVDASQIMSYKEDKKGQILEEGINEAGGIASWIAAATSYSVNNVPMIPFYIYYSMFGFQRIGDFCWAAGDMQARGFLLGGTAGRTTLAGEGLQHCDGHSHVLASTIPNCVAYDPTFSYELAVIIQHGLKRMFEDCESVFFYITLMNENYHHPELPKGCEEHILKGMYLLKESVLKIKNKRVQLLGCGTILREAIAAAEILEKDYGVAADIWSVTSFNELRKEALKIERENRLHPKAQPKHSHIQKCLGKRPGPVIAATDYIRTYADQIRAFIASPYITLGTDGYGRSDTREPLRYFFEVDRNAIAFYALSSLVEQGEFPKEKLVKAMIQLEIDPKKPNPTTV